MCVTPTLLTNPLMATTSFDSMTSKWINNSEARVAKRVRSPGRTRIIAIDLSFNPWNQAPGLR
jgi:hypothetical protein